MIRIFWLDFNFCSKQQQRTDDFKCLLSLIRSQPNIKALENSGKRQTKVIKVLSVSTPAIGHYKLKTEYNRSSKNPNKCIL